MVLIKKFYSVFLIVYKNIFYYKGWQRFKVFLIEVYFLFYLSYKLQLNMEKAVKNCGDNLHYHYLTDND